MTPSAVTIACPHCRRQYTMKIEPERLKRLKTRATCGRCGNTFDAAAHIVTASEATTDPKLPRVDVAPPPVAQLVPSGAATPKVATIPDLGDEMEELAREFAEAAARFTPVNVKRPAAVTAAAAKPSPTNPDVPVVQDAPPPAVEPAAATVAPAAAVAASAEPAPSDNDVAAAYDQLSLEAEPAGEDEFAAAVPTKSRARAAPRGWLELADPGLAALESPPSPGAAALESLLNESERIALPTAAS